MLCGHKWDSSLFLDFHAINHDEINRVLLVVFNSFIIICFNIVQSCTIFQSCTLVQCCTIVQCYTMLMFHKSNNIQFTNSQVQPISWMEPPCRTAPYLDTLFTPPVHKTCICHQDFSSRDSLMHTIKVNGGELVGKVRPFVVWSLKLSSSEPS